jgi:Sulfotransferase domain
MSLPTFLIVGAAKAGTTSLYHYLRQHPNVYMSPVKEPAYYASAAAGRGTAIHTRAAYERLFDAATTECARGEASPQYLNDEAAPDRIAADLRDVRLIVSLRNPVDRAYSSYLGRLAGGTERRRVDEALRRGTYYFDSSLYHAPLTRYFTRFDRTRIRVLLFDELVADTRGMLQEICDFLNVERGFAFDTSVKHGSALAPRSPKVNAWFWTLTHAVRRHLPERLHDTGLAGRAQRLLVRPPDPLPTAIRRQLQADFRNDILSTEALIGRSLAGWLR